MNKHLFILLLFALTFCTAQGKLPIIYLSPETLPDIDCSQKKIMAINYAKEIKKKYYSVFDATSFQLLDAIVWRHLANDGCVQETVADAKIKTIANKVKAIPNEDVLVFLTRFGLKPSFTVNETVLRTKEEIDTLLKDVKDEYLLMIKNSIPYMHADAQLMVARELAKNTKECEQVCSLLKEAEIFFQYDETTMGEIDALKEMCKCKKENQQQVIGE
jgi:hypothetical protein